MDVDDTGYITCRSPSPASGPSLGRGGPASRHSSDVSRDCRVALQTAGQSRWRLRARWPTRYCAKRRVILPGPAGRQFCAGLVMLHRSGYRAPPAASTNEMPRKRRLTIICCLPRGKSSRRAESALANSRGLSGVNGKSTSSPGLSQVAVGHPVAEAGVASKADGRRSFRLPSGQVRALIPQGTSPVSSQTDAALLMGFPYHLSRWAPGVPLHHRVEIVRRRCWRSLGVDPRLSAAVASAALHRARLAERNMWMHASGAIVTTDAQAEA